MIKLNIIKEKPLITNDMSVKQIVESYVPSSWEKVFEDAKDELEDVSEILERDKKINGRYYPDSTNLFRAFELTPLHNVRVVLFGQDPYFNCNSDGTPQAQGLSFSVRKGEKIPSSLINIYKELKQSVPWFNTPTHGDLTEWAEQGVLLLNSCLTVRPSSPGCHKEIWLGFIKKVINAIIDANPHSIFILWGRKAQKIRKMLGERVTILEAAHPSGLSAYRGFFGCGHFVEINKILAERNQPIINWNV